MRSFVSRTLVLVLVLVLPQVRLGPCPVRCTRRRPLRARHVPRSWRRSIPPVPRPWRLRAVAVRGRGERRRVRRFVSRQHRQRVLQRDANGPGVLLDEHRALVKSPNVPFSAVPQLLLQLAAVCAPAPGAARRAPRDTRECTPVVRMRSSAMAVRIFCSAASRASAASVRRVRFGFGSAAAAGCVPVHVLIHVVDIIQATTADDARSDRSPSPRASL